jgi:hypothetical protein
MTPFYTEGDDKVLNWQLGPSSQKTIAFCPFHEGFGTLGFSYFAQVFGFN